MEGRLSKKILFEYEAKDAPSKAREFPCALIF